MDNVHLIQLSSYERPTITEEKNQDWVGIGDNNDYYQSLIDAYMDSTTNNAVINGIVNQIYGKGLDATDSNRKPEQYAEMKKILKPKELRRVVQDLKLLGEGAFQVTYSGDKIASITHFPRETLRAEKCGEDGKIKNYLYSADWTKVTKQTELKKFPVFGSGATNEIFIVRRYVSGYFYYSPADYQTSYATLEKEIADYLINEAQASFSGTKIINFSNGIPSEIKMQQIKAQILQKLTGSYGEKVIVSFNNNAESKTTVDDIPLTDAPAHYEYLSSECATKLMVAHRVTSPLLLGIRDGNNGLGNNADEIRTASLLFNNITIKPYQDLIIECIEHILAVNEISLKLYFKTLQPLEFIETDNAITDEAREEETGVKLAKDVPQTPEQMYDLLDEFGEDEDLDNWELVDERAVDYEQEESLDKMIGLASTGSARPNSKSEQDGEVVTEDEVLKFKVRYQYAPLRVSANSREFCKKMVAAKKIYRKEDIMQMGERAVNAGWGLNGADTYDIWLYKGGGNCHHYWMRKTYMAKGVRPDATNPNAEISVNKARKEGFVPEKNDAKVAKRPVDMPKKGFVNR